MRRFCRLYLEAAPDDTTLIRWAKLIGPRTLERLNERAVALASERKVTRGRKLRTDGTVVETDVSYPTDSGLLDEGVRVLGRLMGKAKEVLGASGEEFRNTAPGAPSAWPGASPRGRADAARRPRKRPRRPTSGSSASSPGLCLQAGSSEVRRMLLRGAAAGLGEGLAEEIERFEGLLERVVEQTERRVLKGESVAAGEKLVSLFEEHTAIIARGKAGKKTEFGRKVWLDEVEGGIISGYRVLFAATPRTRSSSCRAWRTT